MIEPYKPFPESLVGKVKAYKRRPTHMDDVFAGIFDGSDSMGEFFNLHKVVSHVHDKEYVSWWSRTPDDPLFDTSRVHVGDMIAKPFYAAPIQLTTFHGGFHDKYTLMHKEDDGGTS